ncbi:MAG: MBOAT family protein [Eubacterium sp.]|nr:MBOAT family protein [Eubacterium sp.]
MVSYTSFSFFLLYFGITAVIYSIMPQKVRWIVLLCGSYFFYFVSSKGNVIPLILVSLAVWGCGLWLEKMQSKMKGKRKASSDKEEKKKIRAQYNQYKRRILTFAVLLVVLILLICKYTGFFVETVNGIFKSNIANPGIIQPLGISFFVLEGISYMADVYYGKIEAEKNPLKISLYLSFMLTVVEGPVARYDQLGTQLSKCKYNNLEDISKGYIRMVWGLFKKIVIADRAVILVSAVFDNYERYSGLQIAAGIAFYTLQLYCEFSGVMDIVCGLGSFLGIKLPENFNQPFFAKSINEFWQRWHITLGAFLRDYIFYPVSLSKGIKNLSAKTKEKFNQYYAGLIPTATALFFVWFTNGFWHGAGWKYIVYGLYYYFLMMLGMFIKPLSDKFFEKLKINREGRAYGIFSVLRTVVIVNIGMLIFRADDLKTAFLMFKSMFRNIDFSVLLIGHKNGFGLNIYDWAVIVIGFFIILSVGIIKEKGCDITEKIYRLPFALKFVLYLAAIFVIIIFGAYGEEYGVVDLIYANF